METKSLSSVQVYLENFMNKDDKNIQINEKNVANDIKNNLDCEEESCLTNDYNQYTPDWMMCGSQKIIS